MKTNITISKKILAFLLFAFAPLSAVAQCPSNYVCNLAAKTITFQFEAGNDANDRDVACDFVRAHGGNGTDPCSGGSIIVGGIIYNYTSNSGGGSKNTPIILTYTTTTPLVSCPTDLEIARGIGCGQTSERLNPCFSIYFQDIETGQNCTSSNSYFSFTINDIGGCGPYSLVTSGNSALNLPSTGITNGTYTTPTIKAGIYVFVFTDKNGLEHSIIYNHITENGGCTTESNLIIAKSITSGNTYQKVGDTINYQFNVTSTGGTTAPTIKVTDDKIGQATYFSGDTNSDNSLQTTETWVYKASYTILQEDIDRGFVTNQAYADNGTIFSDVVSATAVKTCAQITLTATPAQIVCFGGTGSVVLSSNGVAPFTYGGDATTNLVAGTYNYTVTDANGCTATASATINAAPAAPAAPLSGGDNIKCKNKITQTLTATASVNPDEYVEWYDSATNGSIVGFPTLNSVDTVTYYAQTVTNTNSCPSLTRTPVTLTIYSCAIVAQDDAGTSVNGYTGGTAFSNVLANDTLNGVAVIPSGVTTTFVSTTNVGVTLSGTNVIVAAGTPAGSYTLTYQICEVLNTGNCDTAIVTVPVSATAIVANDDAGSYVNGYNGGTAFTNVIANDTLNGVAVIPSEVTTTFVSTTNVGVTLSGTNVIVAAGTPAGSYTLTYQICEVLNPGNCDTAIVTLIVTATIDAQDDTITDIDGTIGNPNAGNVLGNDSLNGGNMSIEQVDLQIITLANSIGGTPVPFVNPDTGQISIPPGTAGGTYTIVYQICDVINLTNCDDATVTIDVATVLGCQSIVVHNAFSPNGDNKNATFVIDNIEDTACYPENTVEIYNRWGVLVFETKNYSTTNNFDGTSRGRTTISQSSGLPTGTYYYILNYTSYDNNNKIQTNKKDGYLYLTR